MTPERQQKPGSQHAFSNTLPVLLSRAREAVVERFRPCLNANGLTEQQWRVLRALTEVREIEVTPLAGAVFLRGPSLSRILRDLLARGLISRRSGEADMRLGLISITARGVELIRATAPSALAAGAEVSRLYGKERMERLRALLIELEAVLASPAEDALPPEREGAVTR